MTDQTSSADPQALFAYAEVGLRIDAQLDVSAVRLASVLAEFAGTCTEYPLGIDASLADPLRAFARRTVEHDLWVRHVGEQFVLADAAPAAQPTGDAADGSGTDHGWYAGGMRLANGDLAAGSDATQSGSPVDQLGGALDAALGYLHDRGQDALDAAVNASDRVGQGAVFYQAGQADQTRGTVEAWRAVVQQYTDWTGGASDQFPTGGPAAGPDVGLERNIAGFDQLAAENPEYAALRAELARLMSEQPPSAMTVALTDPTQTDIIGARAARMREVSDRMGEIAAGSDLFALAQRNPNIKQYEGRGALVQAEVALLAPLAVEGSVGRAVVGLAANPPQAPFLAVQGAVGLGAAAGEPLLAKVGASGAGGTEGVDQLLAAVRAEGVDVLDATAYLEKAGKAAVYYPEQGSQGVILVRADSEFGDVLHEVVHYAQNRALGFPGQQGISQVMQVRMEIDAYEFELRNADRFGYSQDAIRNVEDRLFEYRGELSRILQDQNGTP